MRRCFFYQFLVKCNQRSLVNPHFRISVLFFLRELSLLPVVGFVSVNISYHNDKKCSVITCYVIIDNKTEVFSLGYGRMGRPSSFSEMSDHLLNFKNELGIHPNLLADF